MNTVLCIFGDSIAHGMGDFEQGGWVARLRKFLDQKNLSDPENSFGVYELGMSGNTTDKLLERFKVECNARLAEREEYNEQAVILFSIGLNDTQFLHKEDKMRISPDGFKKNIRKLIDGSKKFKAKIIFLGLTSVDDMKTNPIPWNLNKSYLNGNIKKYNEIMKDVCDKQGVLFIDIFGRLEKEDLYDGLHPNAAGHQKIFEIVKDFLIKNKII